MLKVIKINIANAVCVLAINNGLINAKCEINTWKCGGLFAQPTKLA